MASIWNGQDRRAWLDRQDQKLTKGLSYYLGPAAQPVSAMARAMAMFSPGADMIDARQSGQELMQAKDWRGRATAGGGLAAAMAGMAIPGTAKGVTEVAETGIRAFHGTDAKFSKPRDYFYLTTDKSHAADFGKPGEWEIPNKDVLDLDAKDPASVFGFAGDKSKSVVRGHLGLGSDYDDDEVLDELRDYLAGGGYGVDDLAKSLLNGTNARALRMKNFEGGGDTILLRHGSDARKIPGK